MFLPENWGQLSASQYNCYYYYRYFCCWIKKNINILNSCPTQGRVEGWYAMKSHIIGPWVPRVPADHAWCIITRADEMKRNGWDECGENGGMIFVVGENGRNPEKNLPRPRFVHHETHMEWPRRELGTPAVGGEHLTACAMRLPCCWMIMLLLLGLLLL